MNIWIINQYAGSPHYGMNYRSYYLGEAFVQEGHKVTLFASSFSHLFKHLPKIKSIFTDEKIDGIDYVWVKTPSYKNSKSIKRIYNMLVFMLKLFFFNIFKRERPDIIIISSLSLFPVLNALFWSKLLRVPFIFEVRDIWPLTLIELGGVSPSHPLVKVLAWIERLGYKKASKVVSVLPNAKEHMLSKGLLEEKFFYIPNGVNLQEVEDATPLSSEISTLIPEDKFIVGYVGTIGIANAMQYLLDTAKIVQKHNKIHFVIVGEGGEKEQLKTFAQTHHLHNVTFIDAIAKREVQSMLKHFDLCYIGWHKKEIYRFGVSANKLFDYMYSAKPILHSISVEKDLVSEAQCGVSVPAEDTLAIADAIVTMSKKPLTERQVLGNNGKNYVIQHHSYYSLSQQYLKLIKDTTLKH